MIAFWIVFCSSFIAFLGYQTHGIFTGDSGDLVTAAVTMGVAHPPGYPLYTALGWLLSIVPVSSPVFRVTLLSSLSHAAALAFVYLFVNRLTKRPLAGVFAATLLFGNYLFFLYSVTPEVFALFDLFIIIQWYLLYEFYQRAKISYWYAFVLVFALSLTHHHIVVFLIPAYIWLLMDKKKHVLVSSVIVRSIGVFFLGLIPYVYVPIAALRQPIINWDGAYTLSGFIRLVTRADYGTFLSSASYAQHLVERSLSVVAYWNFFITDWSWIGAILALLGIWSLYRTHRRVVQSLFVALFSIGPLFLFYASFPLVGEFTLGTYERFLLPSYVLISIMCGAGFDAIVRMVSGAFKKRPVYAVLFSLVLFLYPFAITSVTLWRFWGLAHDKTAQYLAMDTLSSVPPNAIVLLSQDTSLFTAQYMRYAVGFRSDTTVIHMARLTAPDYQTVLMHHFPTLKFPQVDKRELVSAFIKENYRKGRRIYSNIPLAVGNGWYWVAYGLVYEAVPSDALPEISVYKDTIASHQSSWHDPRDGVLSHYLHFMLSDVLEVYSHAYVSVGKTFLRAGLYEDAIDQFTRAVHIRAPSDVSEAYEMLGIAYMANTQCNEALSAFEQAKRYAPVSDPAHIRLEAITYESCVGDTMRAQALFSEYEQQKKQKEVLLEGL